MFIRKDFEDAIKNQFGIEKMIYKGIGHNLFNNCHSFVFDTERGVICIEIAMRETYFVYRVDEAFISPEFVYKVKTKFNYFYVLNGTTFLRIDRVVTEFSGITFDFTKELVVLALEKEN